MKYVREFFIILLVSMIGELIKFFVDLPIPASIYGMVIMFICLMTGIIKFESVEKNGKFLIEIMPVMFIPAGVGLMASWGVMKQMLIPIIIITIATSIAVMAATGKVSQAIIKRKRSGEEDE